MSVFVKRMASTEHVGNRNLSHEHDFRIYKLLLSGGLAGAVSRTLTAPIDRLKFILQIQETARMMSLKEGLRLMAAEGSIKSYFKGNGANVLKIAPETALKLTFNDYIKHTIAHEPDCISPTERFCAGGLSGGAAQLVLYPLDTIRTRLATSPAGTYHGIFHAADVMKRCEGIRAFYRGLVPSMVGILPYAGVDIAIFEILKERLLDHYDVPPSYMVVGAGMVSSSLAQLVSYPLALIRTRLQAQRGPPGGVKYSGMMDVLRKVWKHEGPMGLYKGLLPNLMKMAPAAGISWYVFEESKLMLGVDPRS